MAGAKKKSYKAKVAASSSRLETVLCYPEQHGYPAQGPIPEGYDPERPSLLIYSMLDKDDLLAVRATSKSLVRWVGTGIAHYKWLFETLYVTDAHTRAPRSSSLLALQHISRYCHEIVIRITTGTPRPGLVFADSIGGRNSGGRASHMDELNRIALMVNHNDEFPGRTRSNSMKDIVSEHRHRLSNAAHLDVPASSTGPRISDWELIFHELNNVTTVTISLLGDKINRGWGNFSNVESTIVSIRLAIEASNLRMFKTLRLEPINAFGIPYLRWKGLAAFAPASNPKASDIWQRIRTLEIQVYNPSDYMDRPANPEDRRNSEGHTSQWTMFIKVLHDFLASFSPFLKILRFHWVGGLGPNPLRLDLLIRPKDFEASPITWAMLGEVTLGNVNMDLKVAKELDRAVPSMWRLLTLDQMPDYEFEDNLAPFDDEDDEDWIKWSPLLQDARDEHAKQLRDDHLGDDNGQSFDEDVLRTQAVQAEGIAMISAPRPVPGRQRISVDAGEETFLLRGMQRQLQELEEDNWSPTTGTTSSEWVPGVPPGTDWV